jgi:hypothetical protein
MSKAALMKMVRERGFMPTWKRVRHTGSRRALALAERNAASWLGVWWRLHDLHDNLFGGDTEAVDHSFGNSRHQCFLLRGWAPCYCVNNDFWHNVLQRVGKELQLQS